MPFVDRGVELDARISTRPCGVTDIVPKVTRLEGLGDFAVFALDQVPVAVVEHRLQEVVGDTNRVVGVLARHRDVSVGVPIGIVFFELDLGVALFSELNHALHIVFRDHRFPRLADFDLQNIVLLRVILVGVAQLAVDAGLHDGVQMHVGKFRAGDQGRDLLLFDDLPVNEIFDVRVIDVDDDHLRSPTRGAARLDGAGSTVADFQEAHQARRFAAPRQRLTVAANLREVGARARAVFEQTRFTHPKVHDAAFVHQIVADRLNKAGVRLRVLIRGLRLHQLAGFKINV